MESVLNDVADAVHRLNPSLLEVPPRGFDDELCYDGTPCKDLSIEHRYAVGSWMIGPQRILTEYLLSLIFAPILVWLIPKLRAISPSVKTIQHPRGSPLLSLFCLVMIIYFKLSPPTYKNRIFYVVSMPCNLQWCLAVMQCYLIPDSFYFLHFAILQLRLSYLMSVVIAIVTPETDDCTGLGEYEFYWFNHFMLLILPLAYVFNGSVSCYPPKGSCSTLAYNIYWWLFSCLVFMQYCFGPVTFMAITTGLNLNFMLHPPHDHFLLKGQNFRLVATISLAFLYAISRLVCLNFEKSFVRQNTSRKAATKDL